LQIPTAAMPPERGSFYDSPDRQAIALGFLKKYLEVFDSNRQVRFSPSAPCAAS
jgi:hypothetical protein